ncbi:hypothetical protein B0H13DRAFT_1850718 [Mycena leptocephala]|nr:hypothetical protein B0H13DRAFT_1850718 [Mycena leptocephala]
MLVSAFYSRVAQQYLAKYSYNTPWNGDLPEHQDVADDVDPDEDVNSLDPDESTAHADYCKELPRKIGTWFNGQYGGGVRRKKGTKTFKELFDKTELQPSKLLKPRELHYYSKPQAHQAARHHANGEPAEAGHRVQQGHEGGLEGRVARVP